MFISPMLLHKLDEPPINDSEYITELKLDGFRLILSKINNRTKLYTRHYNEVTALFPELLQIPLPNGTVLDGEIIAVRENGKPDFELMERRFNSEKGMKSMTIQFAVFDIIFFDNQSVTSLPLYKRKKLLRTVIPSDQQLIVETKWIEGFAASYFNAVKEHDLEGIVIKKIDSPYKVGKRSEDWLKIINYKHQEVFISGLRKGDFGVAISNEKGDYLGLIEYLPPQARKQIFKTYRNYVVNETRDFISIEPYLKCSVKYRNTTRRDLLKNPSFVEWIS